ncbi:hypothetical protein D7006_17360 [Xanthobacter sp. YC-JY1]|nr:hypothetical protein D7006_17360 [Xanthobacter sp. YC-JY1]
MGRRGTSGMALNRAGQAPAERAFESFNDRVRDELLNETLFSALSQARKAQGRGRSDYTESRPHSALGWQPPPHSPPLPSAMGSAAAPSQKTRARSPRSPDRQGQIQPPGRTHRWIKLGATAAPFHTSDATAFSLIPTVSVTRSLSTPRTCSTFARPRSHRSHRL